MLLDCSIFLIIKTLFFPTIYYLSANPSHRSLSPKNFKWYLTLGIKDVETMIWKEKKSLPDKIYNEMAFLVLSTNQP